MSTIESLLKEANQRGLYLHNLFQLEPCEGSPWQANVRSSVGFHEFGKGATAVDALRDAIKKSRGVMMDKPPPDPFS